MRLKDARINLMGRPILPKTIQLRLTRGVQSPLGTIRNFMGTFDFTVHLAFADERGKPVELDGKQLVERLCEPLYEAFEGRVSPSVSESVLTLHCHFEEALARTALRRVLAVLFGIDLPQPPSEVYISDDNLVKPQLWRTTSPRHQRVFAC